VRVAAQRLVTQREPGAPTCHVDWLIGASTSVVITAINTKPGNAMYWSQAFANTPWHKEVVATG
jgi:hypothetical protein